MQTLLIEHIGLKTRWRPSLAGFGRDIFNTLSERSGTKIEPEPITKLFGVSPPIMQLAQISQDVIAFVTLLARQLLLL